MFISAHSPMSACCEKSLRRSRYFDSTFSTKFVTNGVCDLFVRMCAICSFVFTYFNSITPLSTYSGVHLSLMSTCTIRPLNPTFEVAWIIPWLSQSQGILLSAKPIPPRMPLFTIVWRTSCSIVVYPACDVDIATEVCDFDFHAIGDASISRRYPVMLLRLLCFDPCQNPNIRPVC